MSGHGMEDVEATNHDEQPEKYSIRVIEPVSLAAQWDDETDPPLVDGVIWLASEEKRLLEARLTALEAQDYIGGWFIERYEDPATFKPAGVLNFIAGIGDDRDAEIVAVWDSAS